MDYISMDYISMDYISMDYIRMDYISMDYIIGGRNSEECNNHSTVDPCPYDECERAINSCTGNPSSVFVAFMRVYMWIFNYSFFGKNT
jgi:hypothetical protein